MSTKWRPLCPVCAAIGLIGLAGCGSGQNTAPVRFEVTALPFTYASDAEGRYRLPEIMGGGGALIDYDQDGLLDVYLVQGGNLESGSGNTLLRNNGAGQWEDVTLEANAGGSGYGMGATAGDFDGDGDEDLYITNVGDNVLLRNDGGVFTDVTPSSGANDPRWSTAAGFFDADGDGDLDLFVVNYAGWNPANEPECFGRTGEREYCGPATYDAPLTDTLFRNEGDGTFTNASVAFGLARKTGNGLGLAFDDFDSDGDIDIFVANDTNPDRLWINEGDGFVERGAELGVARDAHGKAKAGMGVGVGDLDGDLRSDILVVNLFQETDSMFLNRGAFFNDVTPTLGLAPSASYTRFGAGFADFDNDGDLDLYEANGKIDRHHGRIYAPGTYAEPNLLYESDGIRFSSIEDAGLSEPLTTTSRGALFGDIDNDGGMDLIIVDQGTPARLLRNVQTRRHWVMLDVRDRNGAVAIGAELIIRFDEQQRKRVVRPVYSYLSGNDPRVHVGLDQAERIDHVEVTWPDGTKADFGPMTAGRIHRLAPPD